MERSQSFKSDGRRGSRYSVSILISCSVLMVASPLMGNKRRGVSCWHQLTNRPGWVGSFASDRTMLYLAQGTRETGQKLASHTLFLINLDTLSAKAILSTKLPEGSVMLTHKDPPQAVTFVAFQQRGQCAENSATALTVQLSGDQRGAAKRKGDFFIATSGASEFLVDRERKAILDIDIGSFQTRSVARVPVGERALHIDPQSRRMVTLAMDTALALKEYDTRRTYPQNRLSLSRGQRIVQKWDLFGVASTNRVTNSILLREVAGWSGSKRDRTYKLTLPSGYSPEQAGLDAHFLVDRAVVFGGNFLNRRQWRKVFLFEYGHPVRSKVMDIPAEVYAHYAAIDPTGRYAIIDWRRVDTGKTERLLAFEFKNQRWRTIKLPTASGDLLAKKEGEGLPKKPDDVKATPAPVPGLDKLGKMPPTQPAQATP